MKEKVRDTRYDIIRATACFLVILLHCAGFSSITYDGMFNWNAAVLWNSITPCSVPLFVMITGALFVPRNEPAIPFLKKRYARILFPFIGWCIIYFLFFHFFQEKPVSFTSIISQLITGPVSFHFWYIYMILGLYLFLPVINPWIRTAKNHEILLFLALWQAASFLYPVYEYKMGMEPGIELIYFSGFIGYYVLGAWITREEINNKISSPVAAAMAISGMTITYLLILYRSGDNPDLFFKNYLFLNVAIAATGVFIILSRIRTGNITTKIIQLISALSFGIYFVHVIPLKIIQHYYPQPLIPVPFLDIFLFAAIILLISVPVVWTLSKIPLVGKFFN
jgi:surface polysaccharide O-acyltransferase-like enzyme